MLLLLLALIGLLAFANGANDNGKGVAALVGCGAAKLRQALVWAAVTTALGSAVSFWLAGGLVRSFSTGLFSAGAELNTGFFLAVLAGASGWVLLATLTGLPVSTTHAITGALTGAGVAAFGFREIEWGFLGARFAVPLALSPLLSLAAVFLVAWPVQLLLVRVAGKCACLLSEPAVRPLSGVAAMETARLTVVVDDEQSCAGRAPAAAVHGSKAVAGLHWLAGGLVGFARGWNDTPKIAALGIAVSGAWGSAVTFGVITAAMALGGLLAGRRVLETLSHRVTEMPVRESLAASFATAGLVSLASWNSLPVSTTHVATGAIVGAGLRHDPRRIRWGKVGEIVCSWLVTLPVAAALAAAAVALLRCF